MEIARAGVGGGADRVSHNRRVPVKRTIKVAVRAGAAVHRDDEYHFQAQRRADLGTSGRRKEHRCALGGRGRLATSNIDRYGAGAGMKLESLDGGNHAAVSLPSLGRSYAARAEVNVFLSLLHTRS